MSGQTDAKDGPAVRSFWDAFAAATGASAPYTAWAFGGHDTPAMASELALLVRDGHKRATTALLSEYEADGDPLPRPGEHSVILDGVGNPVCIIRTERVEVCPFREVDEEFACMEGEGHRSLSYWREEHKRFLAGEGSPVDDDTPLALDFVPGSSSGS